MEAEVAPRRDAANHAGGVPLSNHANLRNPGMELDLSWVMDTRVNLSASERRVATLPGRRTVKKDAQAAWLLKARDLHRPHHAQRRRYAPAASSGSAPRRRTRSARIFSMRSAWATRSITTGAICVYHRFVATAVEALDGTGIPVAAVSTGFPAGLAPHHLKVKEIEASVADGAKEIDIVITREHVLTGNWSALYNEMHEYRAACGDAHVKAILATGDLKTLRNVARPRWSA